MLVAFRAAPVVGGRVIVVCPECSSLDNEVLETRPTDEGRGDRRRHQCRHCGVRWTSRATVEPGSIGHATRSASNGINHATRSVAVNKPPPTRSVQPPPGSGGGVGGGLSSDQGSFYPTTSDLDPNVSLLSVPRERARTKRQAKTPTVFSALVTAFIGLWEEAYGEKYAFEAKDGVQVSLMLKAHPEYGELEAWRETVLRYLADEFYGRKRHPLALLAAKAREFAGPARVTLPAKVAAGRDAVRAWAMKGAR